MSSWTEHVKAYAAKNKVSYKDALKSAGSSYTKTTKAKGETPKAKKEAGEAKAPVKRKKKEEKQEEMPEIVGKAEKHDKLVVKHEKEKRMEGITKVKGKKQPVLQ
jgi:hypothetical protein